VSGKHVITMRVKVSQRNCTVKRTTVVSGRHGITMRVKVGQRNCTVKRTTVVSGRHSITMRVKVGQRNCPVKRTTVVSGRHGITMRVKVGLQQVSDTRLLSCPPAASHQSGIHPFNPGGQASQPPHSRPYELPQHSSHSNPPRHWTLCYLSNIYIIISEVSLRNCYFYYEILVSHQSRLVHYQLA